MYRVNDLFLKHLYWNCIHWQLSHSYSSVKGSLTYMLFVQDDPPKHTG